MQFTFYFQSDHFMTNVSCFSSVNETQYLLLSFLPLNPQPRAPPGREADRPGAAPVDRQAQEEPDRPPQGGQDPAGVVHDVLLRHRDPAGGGGEEEELATPQRDLLRAVQ